MDEYLAIIKMFAGNFAPRSFAYCQGQILSIATNTALFSLLGTNFGGNGQTTFGLPDLRGRVPVGSGQGPGLSPNSLGQMAGSENVTLIVNNLPGHTHPVAAPTATANAVSTSASSTAPSGNYIAASRNANSAAFATSGTTVPLNAGTITINAPANTGVAGGSQPLNIMQPYLVLNFLITTEGIYPSRN